MKKHFFLFLASFVIVILWRLFWPLDRKEVLLDVPPGKTFYQLAKELEEKKIIRSAWEMKLLIKLSGSPVLPKGEYETPFRPSLWKVFQHLKSGKEREFFVRFPEGLNHYEMAELLKNHNWPGVKEFIQKVWNKNFIKKTLNQQLPSLEGYLFPDSYLLKKYMSAETLIKTMLKRFWKSYSIFSTSTLKKPFTLHQVVTFASLIEKETSLPEERVLIAGVFYNRLAKNMKLQTDPTILYSLYLKRGFDIEKNITKKDILFPSPYNTYVVKGLPPGPIANPGEESLKAVFFPEESDYLYFVSRNDGSHKFSKTYKEHQQAVYKYQIKAFEK